MQYATTLKDIIKPWRLPLVIVVLALLQACSGGSGSSGSERPNDISADILTNVVYSGPAPQNSDVILFREQFYDNVVPVCGSCHTTGGSGSTAFVDLDDVNVAYQEALTVVNLVDPSASDVVTRLVNGHNCWLASNAACATEMTGNIERWAAGADSSTSTVNLSPRSAQAVDQLKILPPTLGEYNSNIASSGADLPNIDPADAGTDGQVLDLLQTYCSDCHSGTADTPQAPFFASDNHAVAYAAMVGKVDVNDPASSRFVVRLAAQHNCWTTCDSDAATMQAAIQTLSDDLPLVELDPGLVVSMAQILEEDGIIASAGGRFEDNIIAKWEFREGEGTLVADTSGVQPTVPLTIVGEFEWFGGWGVRLQGEGRIQGSVAGSSKLYQRLTAVGEYSIEAWVVPNNVTQEDAWIFSYAGGPEDRNLLLTQTLYNYDFYNRSSANQSADGGPASSTEDDDEIAQASLQHVVLTYDQTNGRKIYVNGIDTGVVDEDGPGDLSNWSDAFAVVLGNNFAGTAPWQGVVRMAAVHSRALTPEQILQNKEVGVGQKFFLMFSVADHVTDSACRVDTTDYCYIVFEVSQFDSTSYLFREPRFVNINPDQPDANIDFNIDGIYLGINGQLARTGQGFVNVSTMVSGNSFTIEDEPLQTAGTIIPIENGPANDVFFLAFGDINGRSDSTTAPVIGSYSYGYAVDPVAGEESVGLGMRTFDEVNRSFSWITGVPIDSASVSAATGKTVSETFDNVRRSLPSVADFQTYMASHQMAVIQLAAAYCDALVEDDTLRDQLFTDGAPLDLSTPVASVSNADWENKLVVPLVNRVYGTWDNAAGSAHEGLQSQPNRPDDGGGLEGTDPRADIDALTDRLMTMITNNSNDDVANGRRLDDGKNDGLIYCTGGACPAGRTAEVVKATCTAVLSSAGTTLK